MCEMTSSSSFNFLGFSFFCCSIKRFVSLPFVEPSYFRSVAVAKNKENADAPKDAPALEYYISQLIDFRLCFAARLPSAPPQRAIVPRQRRLFLQRPPRLRLLPARVVGPHLRSRCHTDPGYRLRRWVRTCVLLNSQQAQCGSPFCPNLSTRCL